MTEQKRRRRRRRMIRNIKRTIINLILFPARMPRINEDMVAQALKGSEIAGIAFLVVLLLRMANPDNINIIFVMMAAAVFLTLLSVIKLADYQDRLTELDLYGLHV